MNFLSGWRNTSSGQLLRSHGSSSIFNTSHLLENIANRKCKTVRKKQKHAKTKIQKSKHVRKEENNTFKKKESAELRISTDEDLFHENALKLLKKAMEW
jgi:hypothetical protein